MVYLILLTYFYLFFYLIPANFQILMNIATQYSP